MINIEILQKNRKKIFKDYLKIFDKNKIDYVLLTDLENDEFSGDIDIVIPESEYFLLKNILIKEGFIYYTEFQSNQHLYIKFIKNLGFIQMHVYIDFYFFNKKIFKFEDIKKLSEDIKGRLVIFLIESFCRGKMEYKKFDQYLKILNFPPDISIINLFPLSKVSNYSKKILEKSLLNYITKIKPKKIDYILIFKVNFLIYIVKKIKMKFVKFVKNRDIKVVFWGIDGAGKTTTIKNIKFFLSKGGIYPLIFYFGLKDSFINKIRETCHSLIFRIVNPKMKIKQKEINNKKRKNKMSHFKFVITFILTIFYILEFNFKFLFKIYLNSKIVPTVYLIDRSYHEIFIYYRDYPLIKKLMNLMISPDVIIFLTGDIKKIYKRKSESDEYSLKQMNEKYFKLINDIKIKNILIIDTTKDNELKSAFQILSTIYNFYLETKLKK